MIGNIKNNKGFTVVELLVATAVISIAMVISTTLLLVFFRNQKEIRSVLFMQSQAKYILNRMSESMIEGTIDYTFYNGDPASQYPQFFPIRNVHTGNQTVFWFDESTGKRRIFICEKMPPESCNTALATDWAQMNTDTVSFPVGAFTVYPDESPYTTGVQVPVTDRQPFVTVRMIIQLDENNKKTELIQTGFTPRYYVR